MIDNGFNQLSSENAKKLQLLGEHIRIDLHSYDVTCTIRDDLIGTYVAHVHSRNLVPAIKSKYSAADIDKLIDLTAPATHLDVSIRPHGTFIAAANADSTLAKRTNYDAVWMRDSLWGHLGLGVQVDRAKDSIAVLATQLDYLASQRGRMEYAIAHAEQIISSGNDADDQAIHVRFDPCSPTYDDIQIDGRFQPWTHKQNDALGLLLDTACGAVLHGDVPLSWMAQSGRIDALALLIQYFSAVKYHTMEDSGSWEEIQKRNTSSIGLVVSGLERSLLLADKEKSFGLALFSKIPKAEIIRMIDDGYDAIETAIAAGGESPCYDATDPRFRTADAALLNLVFPAKLQRLSTTDKIRIIDLVDPLVREYGVLRYVGDTYQSANFWFNDIKTDTSAESHRKREASFIAGTEAQWFFDSWLVLTHLAVYEETSDPVYLAKATKHLNRALGQITPEAHKPDIFAADGRLAFPFSLPESYNTVCVNGSMFVLPSPIAPLNWSKSMLSLALNRYRHIQDGRHD